MNNMKWVLHCFINTNMKCLVLYEQNKIHCLAFNQHQSWSSSMSVAYMKYLCPFLFTYQMHHLAVVIQTETFPEVHAEHQQTNHKEKKYTERQRGKGENSSAVYLVDDILCILSVIFFSSAKMDRVSVPLSLPLWNDCFPEVPGDTFFPLSLFLVPRLPRPPLWRIFPPNFMNYLQAFFLSSTPLLLSHLSLGVNSTPASRQTLCLSVQPSVQLYLSGLKKKIGDETGGKS